MSNAFYCKPAYLLFFKLILITAISVLVSWLLILAISMTNFSNAHPQGYSVLSQVIYSLFQFVLPSVLFWRLEGVGLKKGFGVYTPRWRVVVYVFVLVAAAMPVMQYLAQSSRLLVDLVFSDEFSALLAQTQVYREQLIQKLIGDHSLANFLKSLLLLGLLPAVGEELFFRGTLQRILLRGASNFHIAILTTSIMFTVIHLDYYNFFSIFTASLILGYLYHYTRNIFLVIIFHFLSNAWNIIWMFYLPSQTDTYATPLWLALIGVVVIFGAFKMVRNIIFFQHR